MKSINLLKEGRGLRYDPDLPGEEDVTPTSDERRVQRQPRGGAGKTLAVLVLVILFAGGAWWVYEEGGVGSLSSPIETLRQSLPGWLVSKLPGAPPPSTAPPPAREPKLTKAESPAPAPTPAQEPATKPIVAKAPSLKPSPPGVTASEMDRWYRSDRAYPFTILVASFRKGASAARFAGRLASAGHSVTVAPTDLGTRGLWHRVVLDRFGARRDANKAASRLKGKSPINDAIPLQLPFAVEVGRARERAAAEAALKDLAAKGFLAHIFPEAAGPDEPVTFIVLAGAFPSRSQAEAFATTLRQAGRKAEVVTP